MTEVIHTFSGMKMASKDDPTKARYYRKDEVDARLAELIGLMGNCHKDCRAPKELDTAK